MYISRLLSSSLKEALNNFSSVLVTGPRQAGKTTFLLHELRGKADYVSFDDPLERSFALTDPNGFLDRFQGRPVILDEIQYVPEILTYLKIRIDRNRDAKGQWVLTSSQQFQIMKNVSESLAGRIAILDLLPFNLQEYQGKPKDLETAIWYGGYPEPSLFHEKRHLWVKSYIQTYIERDVRQLQNVQDLRTFQTFMGLCAAFHGQTFNAAELSRRCGVSLPTIKSWANILSASYLCHFHSPYYKNYGKRLVKTPKLYFIDSSIACTLTRQPDGGSSISGSMGGAFFEGLIVTEALKVFTTRGRHGDIFFWRSHDGLEVDLIVQAGTKLYPVEIKLTATPTLKHIEPLERFKSIAGDDAAEKGLLVCRIAKSTPLPRNNLALPWQEFPKWLSEKIGA